MFLFHIMVKLFFTKILSTNLNVINLGYWERLITEFYKQAQEASRVRETNEAREVKETNDRKLTEEAKRFGL